MSNLENELGLIDKSFISKVYDNPKAFMLKQLPKTQHTYELLTHVCSHDGLALKYACKRLIDRKLCEISIQQNSMAIEYVPQQVWELSSVEWKTKICNIAVKNDGKALAFVPKEIKTPEMCEYAVTHYLGENSYTEPDKKSRIAKEKGAWLYGNYPIAYVPLNILTKELAFKAINYSPYCIKSIPPLKLTEEMVRLAVSLDGLTLMHVPPRFMSKQLIDLALSNNILAIKYVPNEYMNQEFCDACFSSDYQVLPYLPEEYVSKEMCLRVIKLKRFLVVKISEEAMIKRYGSASTPIIYFNDFPEKLRNNRKVLDEIIGMYKSGSKILLDWNEWISSRNEETLGGYAYPHDKRGNQIKPLRPKTLDYLNTRIKETSWEDNASRIESSTSDSANDSLHIDVSTMLSKRECSKKLSNYAIPQGHLTVHSAETGIILHDFSDNIDLAQKIYYVSDIHIEHQLSQTFVQIQNARLDKATEYERLSSALSEKIIEMIPDEMSTNNLLLIAGDVSNSLSLTSLFYKLISERWHGTIVSVLGNHELWEGTDLREYLTNPQYKGASVESMVADYRQNLKHWNLKLLENEVYLIYKNQRPRILSEETILNADLNDLTDLLSKCSIIIIGGIGFSGLNPVHNALEGLYLASVNTIEEDRYWSSRFRAIYDIIHKCAKEKRVIVLTHTQVYDWLNTECNPNWIYVSGHTHQNTIRRTADGITILSDNQICYAPCKWKLNSFALDKCWYDPFESYQDGIYQIDSAQYMDFNVGRCIKNNGCNYPGKLFMLKRNGLYLFILKSAASLCLMNGGRRTKLPSHDIQYYYDNLAIYGDKIKSLIAPYQNLMLKLSNEIKQFGGLGYIHGCIVDISYYSHIYVNPYDGKITAYWAPDITSRIPFPNLEKLLEEKEPALLSHYQSENIKGSLPLIGKTIRKKRTSLLNVPQWVFGTEMYHPSRIMKAIQYVWEQNVIRIWNDDVLSTDLSPLPDSSKDITTISGTKKT